MSIIADTGITPGTVPTRFRRITHALADALLPSSCLCCGIPHAHTDMHGLCLCEHCAQTYRRAALSFTRLRCPLCRRHTGVSGQQCERCSSHPPGYGRLYSLGPYSGIHARLMHAYKKEGFATLAGFWAEELAHTLLDPQSVISRSAAAHALAIQPVPPRPDWRRFRRFDPVALLARRLSSRIGAPVIHLLRRNDPAQQKRLGRNARLDHARLSYALSNKPLPAGPIRNTQLKWRDGGHAHTVVILDDVRTTGATLDACAQLLQQAGCRTIVAAVVLTHET